MTLRTTPYEIAFGDTPHETEVFPEIAAQAQQRAVDPLRLDEFLQLPAAAEAVRTFVPDDAPPEALEQYRALLHQGYNFWSTGMLTYQLEAAVARFLVETKPKLEGWELALPRAAFYVQLPENLFWGSITPEDTPEAVDGFFVSGAGLGEVTRIEVLLILGVRRDRVGFSVIPFDTEAGPGIAAAWGSVPGRESGPDFASLLPGGEMAGLYSLLTVGEVLKLLGRTLWYIDQFPEEVADETVATGEDAVSRLPYRAVVLKP